MSYPLNRIQIADGVNFSDINDIKFKHNRISVNFVLPLQKDTVTQNAVTTFILKQGYKDCPRFIDLNKKLGDLYGAVLNADVSKLGAYQILSLCIIGLDSRFSLENEDLAKKCSKLLCDIALNPNIIGETFDEEATNLEKQNVIDIIKSEINDKRIYALRKCQSIMCENQPFAIKKYGYVCEAEKMTGKSVKETYDYIIKNANIEVMFVGSEKADCAKEIFQNEFNNLKINRTPVALTQSEIVTNVDKVKDVTEEMDVSQGKLVMGFRTGTNKNNATALRVMTAMYGGTPVSLLFKNVREKLSLCYYCAARYDKVTGIITVDSGVEAKNKQKAQDEIINQLENVKNGKFTQEDIDNTKLILKTALKATSDSLGAIESWYLTQILINTNKSPDMELEAVEKITKEDIVEVAKTICLDTVYFLTSKSEK